MAQNSSVANLVDDYVKYVRADLTSAPEAKRLLLQSYAPAPRDYGFFSTNMYNDSQNISGALKLAARSVADNPDFMPFVLKNIDDIINGNTEAFSKEGMNYFPHRQLLEIAQTGEKAAAHLLPILEKWRENSSSWSDLGHQEAVQYVKLGQMYPQHQDAVIKRLDYLFAQSRKQDGSSVVFHLAGLKQHQGEIEPARLLEPFSRRVIGDFVRIKSNSHPQKVSEFIDSVLWASLQQKKDEQGPNLTFIPTAEFILSLPEVKANAKLLNLTAAKIIKTDLQAGGVPKLQPLIQKVQTEPKFNAGMVAEKLLDEITPVNSKAFQQLADIRQFENSPDIQHRKAEYQKRMLTGIDNLIEKNPQTVASSKKKLYIKLNKFNYRTENAHAEKVKQLQNTLKLQPLSRNLLDFYSRVSSSRAKK